MVEACCTGFRRSPRSDITSELSISSNECEQQQQQQQIEAAEADQMYRYFLSEELYLATTYQ